MGLGTAAGALSAFGAGPRPRARALLHAVPAFHGPASGSAGRRCEPGRGRWGEGRGGRGQADRFRAFLRALCRGDAEGLAALLVAFKDPRAARDAPRDPARFRRDVETSVARWVGEGGRAPDGGVVSLGDLLGELLFRLQEHKVQLPTPTPHPAWGT